MDALPSHPRCRHLVLASEGGEELGLAHAAGQTIADRLGARLTTIVVRPSARQGPSTATPASPHPGPGPPVAAVLEGVPGIEIARFADSVMADLILMIRPAPPGAGVVAQGMHHDAVVRRADVPCLIFPAGQLRCGRMRVALDGSERGMKALRAAWSLRKLSCDGLSAIHVEPVTAGADHPLLASPGTASLRLETWIREIVKPASPPELVVRRGEVVQEVLGGLSAAAGDLLVLGVRRGGPADLAESTGSGRRILAAALCAVLTVPL